MSRASVLGPAVAGTWYPAGRDALASLVDRLLDGVAAGSARAVIAPHAGYAYSGPLAAAALRALEMSGCRRVILLGPSHHFGFAGAAVPDAASACRTPLGDLPIDRDAVATLAASPGFRADDRIFAPEHALESELPFLQRLVPDGVPVVPILLGGGASRADAFGVAHAVAPLLDDDGTRVVVSSDFTHYGPRFGYVPFAQRVPERIEALDRGALAAIEAGDADAFARYVDTTGATICGRRAIDVLLHLPVGAGGRTVGYDTSGRQTGQWDHSVSYAAVSFPA